MKTELIRTGDGSKIHASTGNGVANCNGRRIGKRFTHVTDDIATDNNLCRKCFCDGVDHLHRIREIEATRNH